MSVNTRSRAAFSYRGSSMESSSSQGGTAYIAMILGLVLLVLLILVCLVVRERLQRFMAARHQRTGNHDSKDVTTMSPNERQEYIESVLLTKIHGESEHGITQSHSEVIEEGHEDWNKGKQTCAICLTSFKKGDRISSPRVRPCHIFHRECLTRWLLSHEDCPCCRCTILKDYNT